MKSAIGIDEVEDAIRPWSIMEKIGLLNEIATQLYDDIDNEADPDLWNDFLEVRLKIGHLTEYE